MGYVVNKRDRWYAVGYEGKDPVTGRDQRRWHPAGDEAAARSMAESLPAARSSAAHGMTLARFMRTRWLPARQDRLRPTTFYRYRQMTELYVLPHLGRVPLRRLTVPHLQGMYAQLRTNGRHDGKPLAAKSVLNAHQVLRTALGDAERQGLVSRNVARMMGPHCYGTAPEQSCWNEDELRTFLLAAKAHRLGPALRLAVMTGMRRGEVIGLHWSDIDVAAQRLSLQRSVTCTGYQVHTTPTKTRTSRRPIDDATTIEVLARWRDAQTVELGSDERDRVVFTRLNGHLVEWRHDASAGDEAVEDTSSSRTPACYFCTESHLGDNGERENPSRLLEKGLPPRLALGLSQSEPGAGDHRVDDDRRSHRSGALEDPEELVLVGNDAGRRWRGRRLHIDVHHYIEPCILGVGNVTISQGPVPSPPR